MLISCRDGKVMEVSAMVWLNDSWNHILPEDFILDGSFSWDNEKGMWSCSRDSQDVVDFLNDWADEGDEENKRIYEVDVY